MRIHPVLFSAPNRKNARRYQEEPVPFKMLLPLQLKKTVSGKGDKLRDPACMQEMAVMFACFKNHEFDQQQCLKEVAEFKTCYNNYNEKTKNTRQQAKKGILIPGEKNLTHKQVNKLLTMFPPKNDA